LVESQLEHGLQGAARKVDVVVKNDIDINLVGTASNFLPSTVTVDRQREAIIFLLKVCGLLDPLDVRVWRNRQACPPG
jgi:hypothetical protein